MQSGNNLWAIDTLWLWRSGKRALKKWHSLERKWINGALGMNNCNEKKSNVAMHPLDPACRYWCYCAFSGRFRNSNRAQRAVIHGIMTSESLSACYSLQLLLSDRAGFIVQQRKAFTRASRELTVISFNMRACLTLNSTFTMRKQVMWPRLWLAAYTQRRQVLKLNRTCHREPTLPNKREHYKSQKHFPARFTCIIFG